MISDEDVAILRDTVGGKAAALTAAELLSRHLGVLLAEAVWSTTNRDDDTVATVLAAAIEEYGDNDELARAASLVGHEFDLDNPTLRRLDAAVNAAAIRAFEARGDLPSLLDQLLRSAGSQRDRDLDDDALATLARADDVARRLADVDRSEFLPRRAEVLDALISSRLALVETPDGPHAQAVLDLGCEIVAVYEELTDRDPAHLPGLIETLASSAWRCRRLDRPYEAVELHSRAVGLAEKLYALGPATTGHPRRLTRLLSRQVRLLEGIGDLEGALSYSRRELAAWQRVRRTWSGEVGPGIATALEQRSRLLSQLNRHLGAAEASGRAVTERRTGTPSDLVATLLNHARMLLRADRRLETVGVYDEIVGVGEASDDRIFQARVLNRLVSHLIDTEQYERALEPAERLVSTWDSIVVDEGHSKRLRLAEAMNTQAVIHNHLDQYGQAIPLARRALDLYRREYGDEAFSRGDVVNIAYTHAVAVVRRRRHDAVKVAVECVQMYERLTGAHPGRYGHELAEALHLAAPALAAGGRVADSITYIARAVAIHRELAETDPGTHLRHYRSSLMNQVGRLWDVGRVREALEGSTRLLALFEDTSLDGRATHAMALGNHAVFLSTAGRHREALDYAADSLSRWEELAETDRLRHLPDLAAALDRYASKLSNAGHVQDAIAPSTAALTYGEELVAADRHLHLPLVARITGNHSYRLTRAQRSDEALGHSTSSVAMHEELVAEDRARYLPELAHAISNHAQDLARTGNREEALKRSHRCVELYEELQATHPHLSRSGLAMALLNHATNLAGPGRLEQTVEVSRRATTLLEELAETDDHDVTDLLALSNQNLSGYLEQTGHHDESIKHARRAVGLREKQVATDRQLYLPKYAAGLDRLRDTYSAAGQQPEAVEAARRALAVYDELAGADPAGHCEDRVQAQELLAHILQLNGDLEAASVAGAGVTEMRDVMLADDRRAHLVAAAASAAWLAGFWSRNGDESAGATSAARAVDLYTELLEAGRDEFVPKLAGWSRALAFRRIQLGDPATAIVPALRAVELFTPLAEADPREYLPALGDALGDLSWALYETGRWSQAVQRASECVAVVERAAEAGLEPGRWVRWDAVENLADCLAESGRPAEALRIQEPVLAHREQAADDMELAWSLQYRARWLSRSGGDGLTLSIRADELWERVAEDHPTEFAVALRDHARRLDEAGRHVPALETSERAVRRWEALAELNPRHRRGWAVALADRARFLAHNGHTEEARHLSSQAIATLEELVEELPTAHLPDLADALLDAADLGLTTQPESYRQRALAHYEQLATDEPEPYAAKLTALTTRGAT